MFPGCAAKLAFSCWCDMARQERIQSLGECFKAVTALSALRKTLEQHLAQSQEAQTSLTTGREAGECFQKAFSHPGVAEASAAGAAGGRALARSQQ